MNTTSTAISEIIIVHLAIEAKQRWTSYLTEYDKLVEDDHLLAENYAPLASLVSLLWYDYCRENGLLDATLEKGVVWRIMQEFKYLTGVAL